MAPRQPGFDATAEISTARRPLKMKIQTAPFQFELADAIGRVMGEGRSKGLHLSDVIKYIRIHILGEAGLTGGFDKARMHMGFLLEMLIERALAQYHTRGLSSERFLLQQEYELDGIYLTPDGLDVEDQEAQEYKATWKSMSKLGLLKSKDGNDWYNAEAPPRDLTEQEQAQIIAGLNDHFWHWLVQIQAACWALGVERAQLVVFFVMGDYTYKPGHGPQMRAFHLQFTPEELEKNWEMVLRYAPATRQWLGLV